MSIGVSDMATGVSDMATGVSDVATGVSDMATGVSDMPPGRGWHRTQPELVVDAVHMPWGYGAREISEATDANHSHEDRKEGDSSHVPQ